LPAKDQFDSAGLEFCCTLTPEPHMLDYNGHLNIAYYAILFEEAARTIFSRIDISRAYRERTDCAVFAAEVHTVFHREVSAGEAISFFYRVLDVAGSKIHGMFFMVKSGDHTLAAAQEILFLHVDLKHRKTVPIPELQTGRLTAMLERHRQKPEPPEKGRRVGQRKNRRVSPAGGEQHR
jgi:acyl-CoA thioester hydrolase